MQLNMLYKQSTAELKTVTVDGKSFTIIKLPAFDAMRLSHRLFKVAKPLISLFQDGSKDVDLSKLDFDDEALSMLIKDVVEMCQTDGRMVLFNNDMTSLKMPYLLALEFIKFNFSDFFLNSPLMEKVNQATDGLDLKNIMNQGSTGTSTDP